MARRIRLVERMGGTVAAMSPIVKRGFREGPWGVEPKGLLWSSDPTSWGAPGLGLELAGGLGSVPVAVLAEVPG